MSNELNDLLQDYETVELAIESMAPSESVAPTMCRMNDRLRASIAKLESSRGGQILESDKGPTQHASELATPEASAPRKAN